MLNFVAEMLPNIKHVPSSCEFEVTLAHISIHICGQMILAISSPIENSTSPSPHLFPA